MFNFQPTPATSAWGNQREYQTYEASKLFGRKIQYLQATNVDTNEIFGEAISRDFLSTKAHEMWATRDNDTHFTGAEAFGGFGLIPMYNDILYVPKKFFSDLSITPYEGDLIYYEMESMMFEVVKADTNTEDYNGDTVNSRRFNHKLFLKLYNPADDSFTGFEVSHPAIETFDDLSLNDLNSTLTTDIDNMNAILPANQLNPFGDLS